MSLTFSGVPKWDDLTLDAFTTPGNKYRMSSADLDTNVISSENINVWQNPSYATSTDKKFLKKNKEGL